MNPRERGFLLLTSHLGDPDRKPLTTAQLRTLWSRVRGMDAPGEDRDLEERDLAALGYGKEMAQRILGLLSQEDLLDLYLETGRRKGCVPITLASEAYPAVIRRILGMDATGCLWAKGDPAILNRPMISLVGSRELRGPNHEFAAAVGREAARQGYTLVSGNARGADRTAQDACLAAGGSVVSVIADELEHKYKQDNVLWLSEDGFCETFSAQRALSRNRLIHAMGEKTFVAQCSDGTGGTWDGTVKNLRFGWSPVFCFADGSKAVERLLDMGAEAVEMEALSGIGALRGYDRSFLDE